MASPLLLSSGGGDALGGSPWDLTPDEHQMMSCAGLGLVWPDAPPPGAAAAAAPSVTATGRKIGG